ncbi:DUF2817 domain-containing protein [Patescibacteria group bacterium]|nr:DUF2817 domain-containing protein [Patescibacteria group bacterium]
MSIALIDVRKPTYIQAREAFLKTAENRGVKVTSYVLTGVRGKYGEELAIDVVYIGPTEPVRLIGVSSGVHGIEAYAGSLIQEHTLKEHFDGLSLPKDIGLLFIHIINPFGASWLRRVGPDNEDLNRNFLSHPEDHTKNPLYDELCDVFNPARIDISEIQSLKIPLKYARKYGKDLQEAFTRGQYKYSQGVQFGGFQESPLNVLFRRIIREQVSAGIQAVGWLDIHTGLGSYGQTSIIVESLPEGSEY